LAARAPSWSNQVVLARSAVPAQRLQASLGEPCSNLRLAEHSPRSD